MTKTKSKKVKKVTLAGEIMSNSLVVVTKTSTFRTAIEKLVENRLTALPVVDKKGRLLGIFSEKDILCQVASYEDVKNNCLDETIVYSKDVPKVLDSVPLDQVGALLYSGASRHVLVTDKQNVLKGIISRRDLIRILYLRSEFQKARGNGGP